MTVFGSSWANSEDDSRRSQIPSGEYSVAIIDATSPGLLRAKLFFALSSLKDDSSVKTVGDELYQYDIAGDWNQIQELLNQKKIKLSEISSDPKKLEKLFQETIKEEAEVQFFLEAVAKGNLSANFDDLFSNEIDHAEQETFIIQDLEKELISSVEVNDYLYFKARFINPLEKRFHDNFLADLNAEEMRQKLEIINVLFFQQPFWSIHLAFKIPTSLLEWQMSMKDKQSGQDQWIQIMSADDQGIPDDFESNLENEFEPALSVSYSLPEKKDYFTTRGLTLSYSASYTNESQLMGIVERLLTCRPQHSDSEQSMYFPFKLVFIVNKDTSHGIILKSSTDARLDENSLVNRINAKEDGFFVTSAGLVAPDDISNSNIAIQKYAHYILSPSVTSPFTLTFADSLDESQGFEKESSNPGKLGYYSGIARIIFSGLFVWTIFFWLFFRSAVKRLNMLKSIGLSFLAYFLYMTISLVFSFMLGFGFLLGLITMIAMVKLHAENSSTVKLFAYSLMTSLLTALTMFLLSWVSHLRQ
ncbi:hypothetical protein KKB99_08385 [bacterium]|nr:hypothetical protein [bacterium]MBU1026008.1 hypothetical protein [bacterium]